MKRWFLLNAILFAVMAGNLSAQTMQPELEKTVLNETTSDEDPIVDAEKQLRLERNVNISKVMLGGILIMGIFLITVVLLLGNRFRRIARTPLPDIKPHDPLWYLKDKPQTDENKKTEEPEQEDLPPSQEND